MGGALKEELRVPGGRIRMDLMEGELGLGVPPWVTRSTEGPGWGRVWRQTDPRVGGAGEEGAYPLERARERGWEGVAGTKWVGRGAGLGGAGAECARGSSLATPTPGPGPPAPRPTGRTPAGEPRSRLSRIRMR